MEFIHHSKYPEAFKAASRFTSKKETRPILLFVHHREDGNMYATDAHRAIRIRGIHGFNKSYMIHPKSYTAATGHFPETDPMFEIKIEQEKAMIVLKKEKIAIWLQMFKSLNQMDKSINKVIEMTVRDDQVTFKNTHTKIAFELPAELSVSYIDDVIGLNVEFFRDAMEAFKQMQSNEVYLIIRGSKHPIFLTDDNMMDILVLPVRIY